MLLCGLWGYLGYQDLLRDMDRRISAAHTDLVGMEELLLEYGRLERTLRESGLTGQTMDQNLIAMVEEAVQKISARDKLLYVRPQPDMAYEQLIEEGVEIRLERLELRQLTELLFRFVNQRQLTVSLLRIRPRLDDPDRLDTVMTLSRFREKV